MHVYNDYTKLCGDNHKIKWPLLDTEELKIHDFIVMPAILH